MCSLQLDKVIRQSNVALNLGLQQKRRPPNDLTLGRPCANRRIVREPFRPAQAANHPKRAGFVPTLYGNSCLAMQDLKATSDGLIPAKARIYERPHRFRRPDRPHLSRAALRRKILEAHPETLGARASRPPLALQDPVRAGGTPALPGVSGWVSRYA